MNDRRAKLSTLLHSITGLAIDPKSGKEAVYYQPPNGTVMVYPCIVYERSDIYNLHADDNVYMQKHRWTVTVIDRDPDSDIVQQVSEIRGIQYERHFATDGLNHDIFTLFF